MNSEMYRLPEWILVYDSFVSSTPLLQLNEFYQHSKNQSITIQMNL
jgi:hypothetical protein